MADHNREMTDHNEDLSIPDTPENVAKAILRRPPKPRGEWRILRRKAGSGAGRARAGAGDAPAPEPEEDRDDPRRAARARA